MSDGIGHIAITYFVDDYSSALLHFDGEITIFCSLTSGRAIFIFENFPSTGLLHFHLKRFCHRPSPPLMTRYTMLYRGILLRRLQLERRLIFAGPAMDAGSCRCSWASSGSRVADASFRAISITCAPPRRGTGREESASLMRSQEDISQH